LERIFPPPAADADAAVLADGAVIATAFVFIGQSPRGDALSKELHRFQVGNEQGGGVTGFEYFHDSLY
jgi:hypothetical protein